MPQVDINLLAVLIAAILNMLIGWLWYSPLLFGKVWLAAIGKSQEEIKQSSTGPLYVINTIASLVTAYVLAHIVDYAAATTAATGAQTGFWVWLGFVAMTLLPVYLFEMRPKKLYFIYVTYQLISFIVMGVVLAIWV
jgi:hypothetical protein